MRVKTKRKEIEKPLVDRTPSGRTVSNTYNKNKPKPSRERKMSDDRHKNPRYERPCVSRKNKIDEFIYF